jgi:pyrroloquinoline quinone (PQQ) biosynthesis protein C
MSISLEQNNRKSNEPLTRVWQKWRFSALQTHLWLIKVWFFASTFVVKIATFAKPETVGSDFREHLYYETNYLFSNSFFNIIRI